MRYLLTICLFALSFSTLAQTSRNEKHKKTFKMAADKPGKDSITLKEYYFVMLVKGPDRDKIKDTAIINKLQAGHMANMSRLADEGKLLVAGPFGDDSNWRGIFILDCETQEEAEKLLASDPMIKAGRLGYEIHPWWTGMNSVFK
jgi:uncharacterized protein YciI